MSNADAKTLPSLDLSRDAQEALISIAFASSLRDKPSAQPMNVDEVDAIRSRLLVTSEFELILENVTESLATSGAIVIRRVPLLLLPEPQLEVPTALCTLFGTPFAMVGRLGLWQNLGVDLKKEPMRFGGIGYNPLHIDAVNTTSPPDIVALLCIRQDPLGGGVSLVSDHVAAAAALPKSVRDVLARPVYSEGKFFDMHGVGTEFNPFPIINVEHGNVLRVRFTAKMLPAMPDSPEKQAAVQLNEQLVRHQQEVLLKPGDLLLVNQHLLCHGRTPLGADQHLVPPDCRRRLLQTYLHAASLTLITARTSHAYDILSQ